MKNKSYIPAIEGRAIVLYKKGSKGEVVGRYKSIDDIVDIERRYHPSFAYSLVYYCISGRQKSFASYHHQCRVIAKLETSNA